MMSKIPFDSCSTVNSLLMTTAIDDSFLIKYSFLELSKATTA